MDGESHEVHFHFAKRKTFTCLANAHTLFIIIHLSGDKLQREKLQLACKQNQLQWEGS